MPLPDFLIIGAQKSGTTWLADQLGRNPAVFIAPEEIHYFDKSYNVVRGLGWYGQHFRGARDGQQVGEKTPDYLWANGEGSEGHLPDVHRRLHEALPGARLIVVLRNPVERAISALSHVIRTRRIAPVHRVDDLLVGRQREMLRGYGVIEKGFYYRQLSAYLELYDAAQLLVLVFEEDVSRDPAAGLRRAGTFLGLGPIFPSGPQGAKRNASRRSKLRLMVDYYVPPLRPVSRILDQLGTAWRPRASERVLQKLYELYREENDALFTWMGRPVPQSWKHPA